MSEGVQGLHRRALVWLVVGQGVALALLWRWPAVGWGVSALVGAVVVWWALGGVGRDARALEEAARRYGEGDLGHRAPVSERSWLGRVRSAMDAMASRIADRVSAVEAREREEEAMLRSMASGVLALDAEQRVLRLNPSAEQLLGITEVRSRGRLIQEAVREPELHRVVSRALTDMEAARAEFALRGGRGPIVQAVCRALRGADGRARGLLVVLNDVTESRRFESLRSDFAANVSHELRTPITNIKGYVDTLMEVGWADEGRARRFLEVIARNSDRLAAIVEDVLALTQLEHPRARESLEFAPTPVARVVESVAAQFSEEASAKGITLVREVPEGLTAWAHGALVEQALGNLVSNAVRYSPSGTTVRIEARGRGEEVEVSVIDQGPGIPADKLPRLFERFYRVDKARSRELGGTGLGLAIVKHIALAHGGRAEVESEVGRGSCFRLVLPAGGRGASI